MYEFATTQSGTRNLPPLRSYISLLRFHYHSSFIGILCAAVLAPYAAARIVSDFSEQAGVSISQFSTAGTWIAWAQGVYSLLTWTTVILASRWSIKLRSPKPLLIPLVLNFVLAFVRPWTVADFTSHWLKEALDGEPTAVISFLLIPILSAFLAWVELQRPKLNTASVSESNLERR